MTVKERKVNEVKGRPLKNTGKRWMYRDRKASSEGEMEKTQERDTRESKALIEQFLRGEEQGHTWWWYYIE